MVERAGISDWRAVRGGGARDDPFSVEIVEPRDAGPVQPTAGVAEEHRVDVQWNRIVRATAGKCAVRRRYDNPARIIGLQHADGIGADQHWLARNVTHDEAGALGDGGDVSVGTIAARMRSAQFRTLWPGAHAAAVRLT